MNISARNVLWIVTFFGFAVNYLIRININIAIIAMVRPPEQKYKNTNYTSICLDNSINATKSLIEQNNATVDENLFNWDEKQQSHILGGFYWLHWLLQMPGGILSRKWGGKAVFGLSNLISTLLIFIIPICSYIDYKLLVFIRILQGLIGGVSWPSMHHITAQWIPPNERSKFVSSYLGSSIGVALTYALCGYIIKYLSWEWVFYITGILGVIWYIFWHFLVFDSPAEHPRIDFEERKYIENSLGQSLNKSSLPIPWKEMLTSKPLWILTIVQWSGIWGLFTIMTQAPTYFKNILGWDSSVIGILSGLPHLSRTIFAIAYGAFSDYLLTQNLLSRTNVRKLAIVVCTLLQGLFVYGLALAECDSTLAFIMLLLATTVHGAVSTGPLASVVDLSPNFAGIVQGFVGTVCVTAGFISAYVVGILTYENQTLVQWQKVFYLITGLLLSTGFLYLFVAKSELQTWNSPDNKKNIDREMELLKPSK